ncbi:hypothetical protein KUCAC02_024590, partial [Chaenocephalus aceratus]
AWQGRGFRGSVGAGLPGPGTVGTQWGPVAEAAGSAPEIFAGGPCCLTPLSALTFVVILDEPEVVATASRVSSPSPSPPTTLVGVSQIYSDDTNWDDSAAASCSSRVEPGLTPLPLRLLTCCAA